MKRRHLRLVGAEPWKAEPDRLEWVTLGRSRCLLRRGLTGIWCGYVAIDPSHPWHGLTIWDVPAFVHGGCTWSNLLGVEGSSWWIGFDCGHAGDLHPAFMERLPASALPGWEYRDLAYAQRETNELALQAEAAAGGSVFMQGNGEA